jgi:predicted aldo/keto reductase-like oxidoreductase
MLAPMDRTSPRLSRPSRREVLAGAAAAAAWGFSGAFDARAEDPQPMPRRAFGRTGVRTTLLGLGCFPLGGLPDEGAAVDVILRALDGGCRYLDTAPSYAQGRSETRVGKALAARPGLEVFLATKTHTRTADDARRDVEGSLKRLGVERLDLVQVHAVKDADDLEAVVAKGGPVEALVKAREEGLVRFVGVTGHADPDVMRKSITRWPFDAILFPLNCVDPHHLSFEQGTLPAAVEQGLARVAMKVFASGNLVKQGLDPERCLRYVCGLDVATIIVGCRTVEEVDLAVRVAREDHPLDTEDRTKLLRQSLPHRGKGVEWYKRA